MRWNLNSGKSSGVRIIYIDFEKYKKLFCLMAYPKNVKETLTDQDKKEIRKLVSELKNTFK